MHSAKIYILYMLKCTCVSARARRFAHLPMPQGWRTRARPLSPRIATLPSAVIVRPTSPGLPFLFASRIQEVIPGVYSSVKGACLCSRFHEVSVYIPCTLSHMLSYWSVMENAHRFYMQWIIYDIKELAKIKRNSRVNIKSMGLSLAYDNVLDPDLKYMSLVLNIDQ